MMKNRIHMNSELYADKKPRIETAIVVERHQKGENVYENFSRLTYDWEKEKWKLEFATRKYDESDQYFTFDSLNKRIDYTLINSKTFADNLTIVEDELIKENHEYKYTLNWLFEAFIRKLYKQASEDLNDEKACTSYFIPSLESYYMVKAAIRDGLYSDYKKVVGYFNKEMFKIVDCKKNRYSIQSEVMPEMKINAPDMFTAIALIPYVMGDTFPYRQCDINFDKKRCSGKYEV